MDNFESVGARFDSLPYMQRTQATWLREFIVKHDARDILEIGFYQGKSSAYFAAMLEDLGRGHLVTIDFKTAIEREPNIEQVLSTLGLEHRVTPIFAQRSYTWELGKLIRATPQRKFDLCYFDGGHTWDATGFGFVLVDMLLRPGGWIVFDDLDWTIEGAIPGRKRVPKSWERCSPDERATPGVRLVFDLLVPHLGYTEKRTVGQWGIARKPLDTVVQHSATRGVLTRILTSLRRQ